MANNEQKNSKLKSKLPLFLPSFLDLFSSLCSSLFPSSLSTIRLPAGVVALQLTAPKAGLLTGWGLAAS